MRCRRDRGYSNPEERHVRAVKVKLSHLLITHGTDCRNSAELSFNSAPMPCVPTQQGIATMAKRKNQSSKVQKRKGPKARPIVKKLSKPPRSKAAAKPVAKAKPKRAQVKKAARPVAPAVEAVAVEVIEQPAPGVPAVAEVEETVARQAS